MSVEDEWRSQCKHCGDRISMGKEDDHKHGSCATKKVSEETEGLGKEYGYVTANNICLFQKGPLSQWWGGFRGQNSRFIAHLEDGYCEEIKAALISHKLWKKYAVVDFNCMEQYMMFCKAILFGDEICAEEILLTTTPSIQKDIGRNIADYDDELWSAIRFNAVLKGNELKFAQNQKCRDFLLQFNRNILFAEASPWDPIWGIGLAPNDKRALDVNQWRGQNLLGEVIRTVRRSYE